VNLIELDTSRVPQVKSSHHPAQMNVLNCIKMDLNYVLNYFNITIECELDLNPCYNSSCANYSEWTDKDHRSRTTALVPGYYYWSTVGPFLNDVTQIWDLHILRWWSRNRNYLYTSFCTTTSEPAVEQRVTFLFLLLEIFFKHSHAITIGNIWMCCLCVFEFQFNILPVLLL